MKAVLQLSWKRVRFALTISTVLLAGALAYAPSSWAQEQAQLSASDESGYGRLILTFSGRQDVPAYKAAIENGVLSLTFNVPADIELPDVVAKLPDYVTGARPDLDSMGLRIGLRAAYTVSRNEADNQLYIDLLPPDWVGAAPSLPQSVLDRVAVNKAKTALKIEQDRKAEVVRTQKPVVSVRVARNPTFMRLRFDWSIDTKAAFKQSGAKGVLSFEWPVPVDMNDLAIKLPAEIVAVKNVVSADGSDIVLQFAKGVEPRFYSETPRSATIDIDLAHIALPKITAEDLAEQAGVDPAENEVAATENAGNVARVEPDLAALYPDNAPAHIVPFVSTIGSTIRVVFPFEQDTAAAVFRRGNTVWMVIDTTSGIDQPKDMATLGKLAKSFEVISGGDTQVVRLDLTQDRLATLGSEGRAWVLSLGDIVLTPSEPISLQRERDIDGVYEMVADVEHPARVHQFVDPLVGDQLEVVTAYPPSRGILRDLQYVDFTALRSVHGLVIKPHHDGVNVAVDNTKAVISTNGGLTLSALDQQRSLRPSFNDAHRAGYLDLGRLQERDPAQFELELEDLTLAAATAEGKGRDAARLNLAQYQLANGYAYEALGILRVIGAADPSESGLMAKVRLTSAIANTMVNRSQEALAILNTPNLANDGDALVWRTIAKTDAGDFDGAFQDAKTSRGVADNYPQWVKNRYAFAAVRAAVEVGDIGFAEQFFTQINVADLPVDEVSRLHLLEGRIEELKGQTAEALDSYGQVIAADVRPTRAEAIYRTMLILDQQGKLNLDKATATLAGEAMLWRGDRLEADMQRLLAAFYFRQDQFRAGFETVKQAVSIYPESSAMNALRDQAQTKFVDLFLNGRADALGPVDALSLFYDFRELTPPGARGDEMIRNLARRLVKVDLLTQAAQLLDYQLNNRLKGVAQAQVAADLAVINLADHRPQDALRVLGATQIPGISASLTRQRRVLQARAMLDGGRDELALDILKSMTGQDVDQLRVDAHWRAKRYGEAAKLLEAMYDSVKPNTQLSQPARMDVVKAAVGYVLAGDKIGQSRLRAKLGEVMVTTPEWPMFDYVTGQITTDSLEFKKVAAAVSGIDGLNSFLAAYRQTYAGDGAMTPFSAAKQDLKLANK